jgi:hypothetical protein
MLLQHQNIPASVKILDHVQQYARENNIDLNKMVATENRGGRGSLAEGGGSQLGSQL